MLLVADALLLTIFLVCAHMHAVCPGPSLHCPTLTFPTPTVPIARPPPAPCQPASPHNLGSEYGCGQHDCLLRTDSAALCPASITHSPHHRSGSPSPFLPPLSTPLSPLVFPSSPPVPFRLRSRPRRVWAEHEAAAILVPIEIWQARERPGEGSRKDIEGSSLHASS